MNPFDVYDLVQTKNPFNYDNPNKKVKKMNVYSDDELLKNKPEYKFILVGPDDEWVCDLATEFVRDNGCEVEGYMDCPDTHSAEAAYAEALECLNYSVKVVKK